jgi:protein involved in polysaccharide export with SLBB domain
MADQGNPLTLGRVPLNMDFVDLPGSDEPVHLSVTEIVGYVDRLLPVGCRAPVELHLAECSAVRANVTEFTRVLQCARFLRADDPSRRPAPAARPRSGGLAPRVIVALLAGALLVGPTKAVAQATPTAAATVTDMMPARPGDLIRLKVWREPDLSGDFAVDERGDVVLPQLGSVDVGTMPAESLKTMVRRRLGTFLSHPAIDVTVLRRVQVVGAVQKPGLYHIDPTMTIGDALALAGGLTPSGRTNRVEIIREGQKLPDRLDGRVLISQSSLRSGDQLYVPERSWVSRNTATILAGLSAISALAYAFTR